MNEQSPATDGGLAYWLALDLFGANQNEVITSRRDRLAASFQAAVSFRQFPDDGIVPAHWLYSFRGALLIGILGARNFAQLNAFFIAANQRALAVDDFLNADCRLIATVIKAHADAFRDDQVETIIYGHSLGGAVAQTLAMQFAWSLPNGYVHTCISFGQPRHFQGTIADVAVGDFTFCRYNAQGDSVVYFVPHPLEAPTSTAITDQAHRDIWANTIHFGQGLTLGGTGVDERQDVPPLLLPIAEFSLWNFLLNNDSPTAVAHRIGNYVTLLENRSVPDETRAFTPLGAQFVLQQNFVEDRPRLQPPAVREAVLRDLVDRTIVSRGVEPESGPFYAFNRAGNWQCEFEGNPVTTASGKKNAQAMARRLNAAWRQWWRSKVSSTDNLAYAIGQAFPS